MAEYRIEHLVAQIEHMDQDNARLIAAGVKRGDPSTWRPDLVRPLPKPED